MDMKYGDLLWAALFTAVVAFLTIPALQTVFVAATTARPYLMGFGKFALLATMGELLALRIGAGSWRRPSAVPLRIIVWGVIGVVITFVFGFFSRGVSAAQAAGALPFGAQPSSLPGTIAAAFFTSTIMNLTFGPVLMTGHRLSDTWIDLRFGGRKPAEGDHRAGRRRRVSMAMVVDTVDWHTLVEFVLFRTIPFFWIPAHAITFLLPPEFRVIAAALLSVVLGGILAGTKRR